MVNKIKAFFKKVLPESVEITIPNMRSFWISFIAMFIIVFLQHVGMRIPHFFGSVQSSISTFLHK